MVFKNFAPSDQKVTALLPKSSAKKRIVFVTLFP